MTPTMILTIILTIAALRPFFELPSSRAKREALAKAGYTEDPTKACGYLLLLPVLLVLWWWYALAVGEVLLGVIPTVATTSTVLAMVAERGAAKGAKR